MSAPEVWLALAALEAVKAVGASAPHRKPKRRPPRRCAGFAGLPNSACREDLSVLAAVTPTATGAVDGRAGISRSLRSSLSQRNELMLVSDHLEQQVFPFREHFPLLVEIFKTIVYGGDIREDMVEQPLF